MPGVESRSANTHQAAPTAARFPFCPIDPQAAIDALYKPPIAILETTIAINGLIIGGLELGTELKGSIDDMTSFSKLGHSNEGTFERAVFDGTHVKNSDHLVYFVNGFSPDPQVIKRLSEDQVFAPTRKLVEGTAWGSPINYGINTFHWVERIWDQHISHFSSVKSNDSIVPYGQWLERWGNEVRIGVEQNTLQSDQYNNLKADIREQHRKNPNKKKALIGVSAGGIFVRLAANELLEEDGILVDHVVTFGSPDLSSVTSTKLIDMTKKPGMGGVIHSVASEYMGQDKIRGVNPEKSELQERMDRYNTIGKYPEIKLRQFCAPGDLVVPNSFSARATQIPNSHHATMYYRPEALIEISRLLSTPKAMWLNEFAANRRKLQAA